MMKKKILILSSGLALLSILAFGWRHIGPHGHHGIHHDPEKAAQRHTQKMVEELGLSEEQENKVAAINLRFTKKAAAFRKENDSREAMHTFFKEHIDNLKEELSRVLDEEQMVKLELLIEVHHAKFQKRKASFRENILPHLIRERLAFDKKLSAEERETIDQLRNELPHRGNWIEIDRHESTERVHREEMKQKMAPMRKIVLRHEEELTAIAGRLKHQMRDEMPERVEHEERKMKRHFVRFLLFDPNASNPNGPSTAEISNVKVYPNPTSINTTVSYEMSKAGEVIIELRDDQGKMVRSILQMKQEAGHHEVSIDISDLNEHHLYFISITTAGTTNNYKLFKE